MGRLIDADALKEFIGNDTILKNNICRIVDEQPTAYDVEKVLERLESEVIALEDNYGELVHCIPSAVVLNQIRKGGV